MDYAYPTFLREIDNDEGRSHPTYDEEMAALDAHLFGEVAFQANALRALGHEADHIIVNALNARKAWAAEHGIALRHRSSLGLERGGLLRVRLARAVSRDWMWTALEAQVAQYRPDVLHISAVDYIPSRIVRRLKAYVPLVVGQIAAHVPRDAIGPYDVMISSIPDLVQRFRNSGKTAYWLPLAFESSILSSVPARERDIDVSFIGSFSRHHRGRVALLEEIARDVKLQIWTSNRSEIPRGSILHNLVVGEAFGRSMYGILARSLVTVNHHVQAAGQDANNLRLFEATGMGAMLITDAKRNLGQLFEIGSELVTYDSPEHARSIVTTYVAERAGAGLIAAKGQARTLRDHVWSVRMKEYAAAIEGRVGRL